MRIRRPEAGDGRAVSGLIASCPPLDPNSLYCTLLQCTHFAETCAVAEAEGEVVGWVGGYRIPDAPDALFVWQVAVRESARGRGLAAALVQDVLGRAACRNVRWVHATVTEDNASSWRMFRALAESMRAPIERAPLFDRERHFGGAHATELLLRIGPFEAVRSATPEV